MSESYTPEEMESFLPPQIGASGTNKSTMLLIAELLRTFTDGEHGLKTEDIQDVIQLRTGKRPSQTKVLSDIHELAENQLFGTEIQIPKRGETKGFRCTKAFITSDQARLLINMVQTCKFVSLDQRRELCEALHGMVSYHQQDRIVESVYVDERELLPRSEQDVFEAANIAFQAIQHGKKVVFQYAQRGADGKEFLILHGATYEENPIGLVYSFGNYYLETWKEGRQKRYARRLDKIRNMRVSEADIVDIETIESLRSNTRNRIGQQFDMWGDDTPRTLFFHAKYAGIGYAYDRFGTGIKFHDVNRKKSSGYFRADVQLGATFYRWLFGMHGLISVSRPKSVLWVEQFRKDNPNGIKPFGELLLDCEAAYSGYRRMLSNAMEDLSAESD